MLRNALVKNTATLLSGTVLGQAFTFVITIWLARVYTPAEYGAMAIYTATALILTELVNGRYDNAIMLPKSRQQALTLVKLSLMLCAGITLLITALVLGWEFSGLWPMNDREIQLALYLLPVSTLLGGILQPLMVFINREEKYNILALSKFSQAIATGVISLLLGYWGYGLYGLLAGFIAGQFIAVVLVIPGYISSIKNEASAKWQSIKEMASQYQHFPKFATGATLLNTLSRVTPFYLLLLPEVIGNFSLSNKMLGAPVLLVAGSFAQVFYQKAAREHEVSEEAFLKLVLQTARNLFILGVVPVTVLGLYGAEIFSFVFGERWASAGIYSQYLAPWILFLFIVNPLSNVINIKGKLKFELVYNILLLLSRAGVLYYFSAAGMHHTAVAAFALVSFGFSIFMLIYILYISGLHSGNFQKGWRYLWQVN